MAYIILIWLFVVFIVTINIIFKLYYFKAYPTTMLQILQMMTRSIHTTLTQKLQLMVDPDDIDGLKPQHLDTNIIMMVHPHDLDTKLQLMVDPEDPDGPKPQHHDT